MATIDEVIELIELTIEEIRNEKDLTADQSGVKFEHYVYEVMEKIASTKSIDVYQTGKQTFPDIVIDNKYGVEVKYSKNKKWQSTGNSIFEGTLHDDVTDQVFLLFGKKNGKKIDVRYKKYEDVLADIKVTHSPRFYIDMDVKEEETILHKIDLGYDDFKKLNPKEKADKIKEFVKTTLGEGEELWWLDSDEDITPKVKQFSSLKAEEREEIICECFVLFPELFAPRTNRTKYQRTAFYLLNKYQIVDSSLRDKFSAKGKLDLTVNGEVYHVSRVYEKLIGNAKLIERYFNEIETERLSETWKLASIPGRHEVTDLWLDQLDTIGNREGMEGRISPSDIYKEGLK